jgi:hypothetical protein
MRSQVTKEMEKYTYLYVEIYYKTAIITNERD